MTRFALCLSFLLFLSVAVAVADERNDILGLWEMVEFEGPGPTGECCISFGADLTFSIVCRDPSAHDVEIFRHTATYTTEEDSIVLTREGGTSHPILFAFDGRTLELEFTLEPAREVVRVRLERRPWAPSWCVRGLRASGIDGY